MPRHRAAQNQPSLQVHPDDAAACGVRDVSAARMRGAQAAIEVLVEVTDAVRPGTVALEGKWWQVPEAPGAVANRLAPARWTPAGQPVYNDIFVEVLPVA